MRSTEGDGCSCSNTYGSIYHIAPAAGVVTLMMMEQHTDLREKIANLLHQAML